MNTKLLLPVLVVALVLAVPATGHNSGCGATYCVSIDDKVSLGSGSLIGRPEAATISALQVIAIAVVISQLLVVLDAVRSAIPLSLIRALEHVSRLESSLSFRESAKGVSFWLPIESRCSGRITSKMLRAQNFFGPGRP
jgi:hypothetical protein